MSIKQNQRFCDKCDDVLLLYLSRKGENCGRNDFNFFNKYR